MQVMSDRARSEGDGIGLLLAGMHLQLVAQRPQSLDSVTAVMVPPCKATRPCPAPDWTVRIEEASGASAHVGAFEDRPALTYPHGGPQLLVVDNTSGLLRVVGRYRPDSGAVVIEVNAAQRTTRLLINAGDKTAAWWAAWLVKVFFASRLLSAGWRMLHASAVAVNGSAVLFLAGQRGGKSTLAYRACTELGAGFLADDLVFLGPDRAVVGWPARIALPAELISAAGGTVRETKVKGQVRRRVMLSPAEHRALRVSYSPPVPLGAVVKIIANGVTEPLMMVSRLAGGALEAAVADAADIPCQRLYTSDLLGLTGGSCTAAPDPQDAGAGELLTGMPAAVLRIGDMAVLPTAPVWPALARVLPSLDMS